MNRFLNLVNYPNKSTPHLLHIVLLLLLIKTFF